MPAYVFYMGDVEIYSELPSPDNYILGTWICYANNDVTDWGRLEERPRIGQPPIRNWYREELENVPKDCRTQLLLLRG